MNVDEILAPRRQREHERREAEAAAQEAAKQQAEAQRSEALGKAVGKTWTPQ